MISEPNIIIESSRQDIYGFYQCGNFKTYSRLEAIIEQQKTGNPIKWNFNDEVYSSINWTIEPNESLDELYKNRALQLREKYDYLVLWLSGGADSTNVFRTFINNGIKLDEVVNFVNYDATGDCEGWLNGEIFHVSIPMIEKAKETNPHLKHRVLDLTQSTIDYYSKFDAKFDWIYELNVCVGPNNAARHDIKTTVPDWVKMFDSGLKVGFIFGMEKPRLQQRKGRFYMHFCNFSDSAHSPRQQMRNAPWEFDELFYWSPDAPLIPVKQGHVLKKYIKYLSSTNASASVDGLNSAPKKLTLDEIHKLIYPGWEKVPFQVKPSNLLFSPRDEWFYKLPDSDPAKYAWKVGLNEFWKQLPDYMKNNPVDIRAGAVLTISKYYDLGS